MGFAPFGKEEFHLGGQTVNFTFHFRLEEVEIIGEGEGDEKKEKGDFHVWYNKYLILAWNLYKG